MPDLFVQVRNVCGAPSPLVLLGSEPKEKDEEQPEGLVVLDLNPEAKEWHPLITLQTRDVPVQPGAIYSEKFAIDVDVRHLRWHVPPELRGRFVIEVLRWGNHNLLKSSGLL